MSTKQLALLGGTPVRSLPYEEYNTISELEIELATAVLKTGKLSGFVANFDHGFLGGEYNQALEKMFQEQYNVRHAIAVNSATSGLHACLVAAGIKQGDEVIVPPYTMSATATTVLMCNATPVFCDIEPDYFCLDPEAVEKCITPKTKAIVAVNLFGLPADLLKLKAIADQYNLVLIEDNAQAPSAKVGVNYTGTIGHMGVFSLNRHKTMQCGEGGVVITNNSHFADRCRLVRNHGEVILLDSQNPIKNGNEDIIGYNYRLTELQAAIAIGQFERLGCMNERRMELAEYLNQALLPFRFFQLPAVRENCTHVYYLYPIKYDEKILGLHRDIFLKALVAEGMLVANYVKPLYYIPLYKPYIGDLSNVIKRCPVVESLWRSEMITANFCRMPLTKAHIDEFVVALEKVTANAEKLRQYAEAVTRENIATCS